LAGAGFDFSRDNNAAAYRERTDLALVIGQAAVGDDLKIAKATAVVEFNKTETAFAIAPRSNPTSHLNGLSNALRLPR